MSAFQYDPLTLGEFVKLLKSVDAGTDGLPLAVEDRISNYLDILEEICKIISTSIQIGIQFDDINRQTIIITPSPPPTSSSSLSQSQTPQIALFYDQRQKQYTKIQNNSLPLTMKNNNKIYWSPEKIQTQILRSSEYSMLEGQESIYQLGLMMLDVVYEVEREWERVGGRALGRGDDQLRPDQAVVRSEGMMSYCVVDRNGRRAERNQPLVTQRLNYLISSQDDCLKQLGILFKNMTTLMSQARPNISKILSEKNKIQSVVKSRPRQPPPMRISQSLQPKSPNSPNSQNQSYNQSQNSPNVINSNRNSIQPFRSLQSISEEPINTSQAQTMRNIGYGNSLTNSNNQIPSNNFIRIQSNSNIPNPISNPNSNMYMNSSTFNNNDPDSLKYSDNSIHHNSSEEFKFTISDQGFKKGGANANVNGSGNSNFNANIHIGNANGIDYSNVSYNISQGNGSPSPVPYRKEVVNPQSDTTVNSEALRYIGRPSDPYHAGSSPTGSDTTRTNPKPAQPNTQSFIKSTQLFQFAKNHHKSLISALNNSISQLQQLKKTQPQKVLKKQYHDGSSYYGCFDQQTKKKLGLGIYVYNSGDIYFGKWEDNMLVDGVYLFRNGESFEGVVRGGKQGQGTYRYANGNVYVGMWKDDLKNGRGVMMYPNGAKYEGDWLKGKKHGEGVYYYENGIVYRGGFALGKKYGNGLFIFQNGTKIQGFWDNNHLQGFAKIYYQNGDYYEGNFHMSQKSGEGTYKWSSKKEDSQQGQVEYKGTFKKDSLQGFAIIKFSNGQIYQGKVKNGKRNGQGSYKYTNGDQFKGEWKNDQKQMGKYKFSTGDQFEGKFKQGQMSFGLMRYRNGEIYQGEFRNGERNGIGAYSNKVGQVVYEGYWQGDQFKENSNAGSGKIGTHKY